MLKKRAVLVALLLIFLLMANAMAQSAEDITGQCQVEYSARGLNWKKMSDGDLNTLWKSKELKQQTLTFQLPAEMAGGGVYLTFKEALPAGVSWTAQYQTAEDQWQSGAKGELTYLNTFVPVQGNTFRLIFEKDKKFTLSIREIRVFSSGELPAEVQMWRTPEQADALVVLSGCGEQKLSASIWKKESSDTTVVAVMAKTNALKTLELLDELWSQGVVNYPALGQFKATSSSSAAKVASLWKTKKMDTFLTEVYRDYRPERVYAPEENSTGADGAAGLSARRSIPLAGTIQWDLNSGKDHGVHIPSELYALQGEEAWLTGSWDSETMIPQMMREELGQVQRADASAFMPEGRDTEGYLTEGTFTYADEENGVWIYLSKDLQVTITHCFEPQTPLTWFEAEIWSDVAAGEVLKTVQYDAEKMGKARADALVQNFVIRGILGSLLSGKLLHNEKLQKPCKGRFLTESYRHLLEQLEAELAVDEVLIVCSHGGGHQKNAEACEHHALKCCFWHILFLQYWQRALGKLRYNSSICYYSSVQRGTGSTTVGSNGISVGIV